MSKFVKISNKLIVNLDYVVFVDRSDSYPILMLDGSRWRCSDEGLDILEEALLSYESDGPKDKKQPLKRSKEHGKRRRTRKWELPGSDDWL